MSDAFQVFLEEPTRDNYRRVRQQALADPDFDPGSLALSELHWLCQQGDFTQVVQRAESMWWQWRLSPRFHWLAGRAASELRDADGVELARFQFQSCLEGILSTGLGTAHCPYEVVRVSDEYDVLRALGLESISQCMVERDGWWLDVVTCARGREVWFDPGQPKMSVRRMKVSKASVQRTPNPTANPL